MDDAPLNSLYRGVGSQAFPPQLMLKMVLYEYLQGRLSPAQWHRDAKDSNTMRWLGFGIEPSRTAWYGFRDRVGHVIKQVNEDLVRRAIDDGLVSAEVAAQDGSAIAACASRHRVVNEKRLVKRQRLLRRIIASDRLGNPFDEPTPVWTPTTPSGREDLAERMKLASQILGKRLEENARKPKGKRKDPNRIYVSLTDPEAAMGRDKFKVFRPLYTWQFMVEQNSLLILGYQCRPEATDAATLAPMIDQVQEIVGHTLRRVLADAAYASLADLLYCKRSGIDLVAPVQANSFTEEKKKKSGARKNNRDEFIWDEENQTYHCPAGHKLKYIGKEKSNRSGDRFVTLRRYHCAPTFCQGCALAPGCVTRPESGRTIKRMEGQELLDAQRRKMNSDAVKASYRERSQLIERAFADAKRHREFHRFHGRTPFRAETETGLLVLAQNLLTLDRLQREAARDYD